jgi:putative sterol carrier protein
LPGRRKIGTDRKRPCGNAIGWAASEGGAEAVSTRARCRKRFAGISDSSELTARILRVANWYHDPGNVRRPSGSPRFSTFARKESAMPPFKDTQQMYEMLEALWNHIISETDFGGKLKEYDITFKFVLTDPNGYLWVGPDKVITGDEANQPAVITMELSGDTTHKYWLKQISLPVALATRKIKSKGPIPKVLKILPFLKPVYEKYPVYCQQFGIPTS